MAGDTPSRNKYQEPIEWLKTKHEKLFFGLKIFLILLYLFAKFLAVKSSLLLKGLAGITVLPLPLTFAVFAGLTSEKFSIALTVLIYCILTYQLIPTLMKPLFGEFCMLWWVRAIVVALACVNCLIGFIGTASDYFYLIFFLFYILSGIPLGKMLLNQSDMVQWTGPVPALGTFESSTIEELEKDKEEIIQEYKGGSDDQWLKRKITRFAPMYISGLVFTIICAILGVLFWVFLKATILFVIIISMWLLKDIHKLIRKKSLFKRENVEEVVEGVQAPETNILLLLLTPKKHAVFKQLSGVIGIIGGIAAVAIISSVFVVFASFAVTFPQMIISGSDFETSMAGLMLSINGISLILAVIFQSYFWYALVQRFPYFLDVWIKKDFSTKVDVPQLPTGGFPIFLVNTILIVFLFTFILLWFLLFLILYERYGEALPYLEMAIGGIAILILPLSFEIYLLYSTIKSRKQRETDPKNLYKDNKRIPFAASIQFFSFFSLIFIIIFLVMCRFAASPLFAEEVWDMEDAKSKVWAMTLIVSFVAFIIIPLIFYIEDIECLLRKKDAENPVKRRIKTGAFHFIFALMIFIAGLVTHDTGIYYIGIFASIVMAVLFILEILSDKPKTRVTENRPKNNGSTKSIQKK